MKVLFRKLPLATQHQIKNFIYALPFLGRHLYPLQATSVYVISYPKCGRTWLRLMLGQVLRQHFDLADINPLQLEEMAKRFPDQIPLIKFTHDDYPNLKSPHELSPTKTQYRHKRVIFLVRDVRDVVVSYYFELTRRNSVNPHYPPYHGDLASFLHYQQGSVDTIIRYYNIWATNRHIPSAFLLVRYEDMMVDPARELRRVLDFLNLKAVNEATIHQAIVYASFENMRKLEQEGDLDSFRLRPGDIADPESYKTRRGKVGGFVDYLSQAEIDYLNQKIATELADYFGYR